MNEKISKANKGIEIIRKFNKILSRIKYKILYLP